MRLTNNLRDAFIRAVMDDVPSVNHSEEIRKVVMDDVLSKLPTAVYKIYKDPKTQAFVKTTYKNYAGVSVTVPSMSEYRSFAPVLSQNAQETVDKLEADYKMNCKLRGELSTKLRTAAYGCTTRKQLAELLPEFDNYLPADDTKATKINLPVAADVFSDFVKAGWPKTKKHLNKQITI